jgi:hypothetical protein
MLEYFDLNQIECLCNECYAGEQTVLCGNPPRPRDVAVGCLRVPLILHPAVQAHHRHFQHYYTSFYGTSLRLSKDIICSGRLLLPGDTLHNGVQVQMPERFRANSQSVPVWTGAHSVFGPTYRLVNTRDQDVRSEQDHDLHNRAFHTSPSFRHEVAMSTPIDWEQDNVCVCFELLQHPSSINVLISPVHASVHDPHVPNDGLMWFTERQYPAVVVAFLLIQIGSTCVASSG